MRNKKNKKIKNKENKKEGVLVFRKTIELGVHLMEFLGKRIGQGCS